MCIWGKCGEGNVVISLATRVEHVFSCAQAVLRFAGQAKIDFDRPSDVEWVLNRDTERPEPKLRSVIAICGVIAYNCWLAPVFSMLLFEVQGFATRKSFLDRLPWLAWLAPRWVQTISTDNNKISIWCKKTMPRPEPVGRA